MSADFKRSTFSNCKVWLQNVSNCGKDSLGKLSNFEYFCIPSGNLHHFSNRIENVLCMDHRALATLT